VLTTGFYKDEFNFPVNFRHVIVTVNEIHS
jgi:hypothetical protein